MAVEIDLSGHRALVTGGGQGVGEGISLLLAEAGAEVVVNDIVGERAQGVVDQIEAAGGALAARPEAQVFEPADPARVMPRWLVFLALLALVAVAAAFLWNRNRELNAPDEVVAEADTPAPAVGAAPTAPAPAPASKG